MLHENEAQSFIDSQNSLETARAYSNDLKLWFGQELPLTVEGVSQYKVWLSEKYKANGSARRYNTVRTFYRWLARRGVIEFSPFDFVKAPKRPRTVPNVPSDEEVEKVVNSTKTEREAVVVSLLLNGLRASEVANLRADSLRYTREYGHFLVVLGKGEKERLVPLLDETVTAINTFNRAQKTESEWLVYNYDGSKLSYDMVNGIVDMAARKAKVKIHPHSLRHHYATRLIRAGANVFAVQGLLGHDNVSTTQHYVQMDMTDLVKATSLDPRNKMQGALLPS